MGVCYAAQTAPQSSSYYAVKDSCYLVMSVDFLNSIFNELFTLSRWMAIRYSITSIPANLYTSVHMVIDKQGSISYSPLAGWYLPSNLVVYEIFGWAAKVMSITKMQEVLIVFMATGGFVNIFILGLILRAFAFTKKLGGSLMGIALAMILVYPGFYAFGDYIMNNIRYQIAASQGNMQQSQVVSLPIFSNINFSNSHMKINPLTGNPYPTTSLPANASDFVNVYDSRTLPRGDGSPVLNQLDQDIRNSFEKLNGYGIDPTVTSGTQQSKTNAKTFIERISDLIDMLVDGLTPERPSTMYGDNGLIDMVARGTFFSLWFGLLSIIATIAAARSFGSMFGGDVEFAGLARLI